VTAAPARLRHIVPTLAKQPIVSCLFPFLRICRALSRITLSTVDDDLGGDIRQLARFMKVYRSEMNVVVIVAWEDFPEAIKVVVGAITTLASAIDRYRRSEREDVVGQRPFDLRASHGEIDGLKIDDAVFGLGGLTDSWRSLPP
jgi:hypothetical protein